MLYTELLLFKQHFEVLPDFVEFYNHRLQHLQLLIILLLIFSQTFGTIL